MAKKKIGLDRGHGLHTAGKQTPDGIKEWTLNDKVCDKAAKYLADYDVEIIFTDGDEGETDESLASRKALYLKENVDVFVSIHHNANTGTWNKATGVEVYTDRTYTKEDQRLAECIHKRLVAYTGMKDRGIKRANWAVINQNKIPAVLTEGGFMDGIEDYKYIISDEGQDAYARAIADGLVEFLGLEKKSDKETKPTSTPTVGISNKKEELKVDGEWGIATTEVSQRAFGTITDGEISHQLTSCKKYLPNCLTASWEFDDTGKGSQFVRKLQTFLDELGYYKGEIDGLCGKKTVMAMQDFLKANGFNCGNTDGIMGEKTVMAWQMYVNSL